MRRPRLDIKPNIIVRPTMTIPVVYAQDGDRRLNLMRWGFVPPWEKVEPLKKPSIFNARSDKVALSNVFKSSLLQGGV